MTPRVLATTAQRAIESPLRRVDAVTGRNYADALLRVGTLPFLLPNLDPATADAYLDAADGVVLTGGCDVDPAYFGQDPAPDLGVVDPQRDAFELALYRGARERGLPVLGICRGVQVMAVAAGGSLHQHLPACDGLHGHEQAAREGRAWHALRLAPGSRLAAAFGAERVRVNSYHHQGVDRPGEGLAPVAWSADGLVEAVEARDGAFALGVQWHPEMGFAHDDAQLAPFRAFAEAVAPGATPAARAVDEASRRG